MHTEQLFLAYRWFRGLWGDAFREDLEFEDVRMFLAFFSSSVAELVPEYHAQPKFSPFSSWS